MAGLRKFSYILSGKTRSQENRYSHQQEVKNESSKKSGQKEIERTYKVEFRKVERRIICVHGNRKNPEGSMAGTFWRFSKGYKKAISRALIGAISFYQKAISPSLPHSCRYYPTCSEYTKQAILKYGPFKGLFKGILRILRCNPFFPGGYDPV